MLNDESGIMEKYKAVLVVSILALIISLSSIGYAFYMLSSVTREFGVFKKRVERFLDYMGRQGFSEYTDYERELYDAALANGEVVTFYTSAGAEAVYALEEGFTKRYPGIETNIVLGPTVKTAIKIIEEVDTGVHGGDVFVGAVAGILSDLTNGGYFEEYIPHAIEPYPSYAKIGSPYWYTATPILMMSAYNTELVSAEEAPLTWQEFLDPQWKGKLGLLDWKISQASCWRLYKEYGADFMEKLGEQDLHVYDRTAMLVSAVVSGEISIAIFTSPDRVKAQMDLGAPILPLPVTPMPVLDRVVAIIKNTPNMDASKLFVEYLLSVEGQTIFNVEEGFTISYHPDAPEPKIPGYVGEIETFEMDWKDFLASYSEDVEVYDPLLRR